MQIHDHEHHRFRIAHAYHAGTSGVQKFRLGIRCRYGTATDDAKEISLLISARRGINKRSHRRPSISNPRLSDRWRLSSPLIAEPGHSVVMYTTWQCFAPPGRAGAKAQRAGGEDGVEGEMSRSRGIRQGGGSMEDRTPWAQGKNLTLPLDCQGGRGCRCTLTQDGFPGVRARAWRRS